MKDLVILADVVCRTKIVFQSFLESRLFSTKYQTAGTGRLLTGKQISKVRFHCWPNVGTKRERGEKRKQHFWFGKLPLKMDTFLAKIIANRTLFSTSTYSIVRESVSLEETYDSEIPVQLSTTVKIFSRQFCRWRK